MAIPPLPPELNADVLARRDQLPLKPAPVSLVGQFVELKPLDLERDTAALFAVSNGSPIRLGDRSVGAYNAEELIWRYMNAGPFTTVQDLHEHLRTQVEARDGQPLCVFDRPSGMPVGVANFITNVPQHLKIELGSIWYSPLVQGSKANREATYLMLEHAFSLGYRRLEWKCNALNERSRRAALNIGFKFEGIQEAHYIIKGRSRDTAWFRILDREWPTVRAALRQQLYGE